MQMWMTTKNLSILSQYTGAKQWKGNNSEVYCNDEKEKITFNLQSGPCHRLHRSVDKHLKLRPASVIYNKAFSCRLNGEGRGGERSVPIITARTLGALVWDCWDFSLFYWRSAITCTHTSKQAHTCMASTTGLCSTRGTHTHAETAVMTGAVLGRVIWSRRSVHKSVYVRTRVCVFLFIHISPL